MSAFVVVTSADIESDDVLTSLGGGRVNLRMGIVRWWGATEDLYSRLAPLIPAIALIAPLDLSYLV